MEIQPDSNSQLLDIDLQIGWSNTNLWDMISLYHFSGYPMVSFSETFPGSLFSGGFHQAAMMENDPSENGILYDTLQWINIDPGRYVSED